MNNLLSRALGRPLLEALHSFPVVVLTGARQTGKSTLARDLSPARGRTYLSLDDFEVREQAALAPEALATRAKRLTLDEVQRQPDLLIAIKSAVDRERRPGRFLITGSANLLLMGKVSESLAGRAIYQTLWPMTRRELLGLGKAGAWDIFFRQNPKRWIEKLEPTAAAKADWRRQARLGGYPEPAHRLQTAKERKRWFLGYTQTYLERDLQQLSMISALSDFRGLMQACALRVGQVTNQANLGRVLGLSQPTVHRYLNLLETSYQLVRLPAFALNRSKRLIKSPKMYWSDTGLGLFLAGTDKPEGTHLENLVLQELLAWASLDQATRTSLSYWRTTTGVEVDFVIERGQGLLPVEVKASGRPRVGDARGLRVFLEEYGDRAPAGLIVHAGNRLEWITEQVLGVPWWMII